MSCNSRVNNDNCGKCLHNLLSINYIKSKSIVHISRVAANLLWMNEFNDSNKSIESISNIKITCTNSIIISIPGKNNTVGISTAKYIYCRLINAWYDYYKDHKDYEEYNYIKERLDIINAHSYINKIRVEAVAIAKYLYNITVCNGNCTVITTGKEVSKCKIPLSDINRIVKLNSDGLVDVLNTILYTIKDLRMLNLTIDLDTTYITCAGNIIMDRTFVKSKCSLSDMKSTYIYYLSAWCSANFCKQYEVTKIKDNINSVNKAKRMTEIYDLSCDLLNIL